MSNMTIYEKLNFINSNIYLGGKTHDKHIDCRR